MISSHLFSQGVHDQLYRLLAKLKKHTDNSGSFFGALGFTSLVEQLALRTAPVESLLNWLTMPTDPHLVEVVLTRGIKEASKVIPLPYIQPLFLDVLTASDVTNSKKPRSPCAFRAFRLHRVIYAEGSTVRTQVAYPHLGGKTKSHLLNFQMQQLIPELHEHSMISAALEGADDGHWNITNDPIYPAGKWKCSGGGMNPLRTLKQTSPLRGQAQEGEVPQVQ